ncbi:MAG: hypothetical protein H0T53_05530 [Herpetosiphonaceae bacterium]|nr:hypothetical protein [Herpetosiphonaceae bacterium]
MPVNEQIRFARAVYTPSYTSQVFGAITSMELLLTSDDQITGFASLEQRIVALVGKALAKRYDLRGVLQVRHGYVHRGLDILDRRPAVQALGIAITVLCRYATIADRFRSKQSQLSYLDLAITNGQISDPWLQEALAVQPTVYDVLQSIPELPFHDYVDAVLDFDADYHAGMFDRWDRIYAPDDTSIVAADDEITGLA